MLPRLGVGWKTGFEIELLLPRGRTRRDLAALVAGPAGSVGRFFHPQSEPSQVKGSPTFENLTPGFEARDAGGRPLARFVDDLTLQAELDRGAPALPGWYRIVTDDGRLLRLAMRHCDAEAPLAGVLDPLAALFGTRPEPHPSGMLRVSDERGVSVAIAAPLPGERERTCEIVTPPLEEDHEAALDGLLAAARALGCTLPLEGATHLHFDATALASAPAVARLVALFSAQGEALKRLVGSNPFCIRLGPWPDALLPLVSAPGFATLDWPAARQALAGVGLTKYCDVNLVNLVQALPGKHTVEVRTLPATLDAGFVADAAELFAGLLRRCADGPAWPSFTAGDLASLLRSLPLSPRARRRWCDG